jgi:osmotically-inducible protein OsmY
MKSTYIALSLILAINWNPQLYALSRNAPVVEKVDHVDQNQSANKVRNQLLKVISRDSKLKKDTKDIQVTVGNGYLVLRGIVESDKEKAIVNDLALKCCHSDILNELEVTAPSIDLLPYAQINGKQIIN